MTDDATLRSTIKDILAKESPLRGGQIYERVQALKLSVTELACDVRIAEMAGGGDLTWMDKGEGGWGLRH